MSFYFFIFFLLFPFQYCLLNITNENDIYILNPDNFDSTLNHYDIALIEFYYMKCGHCIKFEPIFSNIGKKFNNDDKKNNSIFIGKIDDSEYIKFTSKFRITHYPTLLVFHKGMKLCEINKKTEKEIENELNLLSEIILNEFNKKEDIEIAKLYTNFILLYLGNNESDINVFKESNITEGLIKKIIKDKDLIKLYGEEGNIILINNIKKTAQKFEDSLNLDNLNNFIIKEGKNYVKKMDKNMYLQLYLYQSPVLYLFVNCDKNKQKCENEIEIFEKGVKEMYNDEEIENKNLDLIYFIKVDISDKNNDNLDISITKDYEMNDKETPVIILNYTIKKQKYIFNEEFNSANIHNYIKKFLKGELSESENKNEKNVEEKKIEKSDL